MFKFAKKASNRLKGLWLKQESLCDVSKPNERPKPRSLAVYVAREETGPVVIIDQPTGENGRLRLSVSEVSWLLEKLSEISGGLHG